MAKQIKKKKRKFWFEINEDAKGYPYGDNRAISPAENRQDVVRRTWNI
jgi:hypothetical protein